MHILEATAETAGLPALKRAEYSYAAMANTISRRELGERCVAADVLAQDFAIAPFWQEPHDLEGECYASYIATHPDFSMQLRKTVAEKLIQAQRVLPTDWQLVLKAGFRPLGVQQAVLEAFTTQSRQRYPERSEDAHRAHARTFVADPTLVCPPHTTGGAVDIEVQSRRTGTRVDMGTLPNDDSECSFLFSQEITTQAQHNRMTLLAAMLEAGFAPNPYEWWHYQYGETYWAAFYGQESTFYDILQGV